MKLRVKDISSTMEEFLSNSDPIIKLFEAEQEVGSIFAELMGTGVDTPMLLSFYYTKIHSKNKILNQSVVEAYNVIKQVSSEELTSKVNLWSYIFALVLGANQDKYTVLYPQIKGLYEHIADSVNVNRNINKSYMSTHDKTLTAQKVSTNDVTDTGTTKEATNQVITTNDQSTNSYHGFNVPEQRPVNSDTATSTETTTGNADDNIITTNSTKQGNETVDDTETHKDDINGSDTITAWTVGSNKNKTLEALTSIQNLEQMKIINMICKDIDNIITLKIY